MESLLLLWWPRHWRNPNGAPPCVLEFFSQAAVCPNSAQYDTDLVRQMELVFAAVGVLEPSPARHQLCVPILALPIDVAVRCSSDSPAQSLALNSEEAV